MFDAGLYICREAFFCKGNKCPALNVQTGNQDMKNIIYKDQNVTIFQSALFQTNSTVVLTEDVVLVVDPAWLPDEVLTIKHYVDGIRGSRELFLIFTHSDYDHIIGYRAFHPDKVFMSKMMDENPEKQACVEQVLLFDEQYYINRPYPIEYPKSDFVVYKDGVQYRIGQTKMTFYLTPGHTKDSMMVVVWQIGLCIAGDYLSNVEFPLIYDSSMAYEDTLEKLPSIHDRNWFTRLVPGHGDPALTINEWLHRRTESLSYIYALRESIATGVALDEKSLWDRYKFPRIQQQCHLDNITLMTNEYAQGLWTWDAEVSIYPTKQLPPDSLCNL
jgi:glyoxylase-like metal-dependent hydrolase (beta-lactamase superfamily II)